MLKGARLRAKVKKKDGVMFGSFIRWQGCALDFTTASMWLVYESEMILLNFFCLKLCLKSIYLNYFQPNFVNSKTSLGRIISVSLGRTCTLLHEVINFKFLKAKILSVQMIF